MNTCSLHQQISQDLHHQLALIATATMVKIDASDQPLQLLYPVPESAFLGGLVIELAPAILPFPVVKQTWADVVTAAELSRAAFAAEQLLNYLALEL